MAEVSSGGGVSITTWDFVGCYHDYIIILLPVVSVVAINPVLLTPAVRVVSFNYIGLLGVYACGLCVYACGF